MLLVVWLWLPRKFSCLVKNLLCLLAEGDDVRLREQVALHELLHPPVHLEQARHPHTFALLSQNRAQLSASLVVTN